MYKRQTIDGDEYFITAKRFSSSPDWLNITFCPTKSLYSSYRQMLRLLMTIMIFIILITMLLSLLTFSSTKKSFKPVSYTHLDVYKRQTLRCTFAFAYCPVAGYSVISDNAKVLL